MPNLFEQVNNDIKAAMLAKDKVRLNALRNVKRFFIEAQTAPGANDTLTDDDALKIIRKLVKQGKDAAEIYTRQNRPDLAAEELAQIAALESYLPRHLAPEALEAELRAIIQSVGATSPADMGKVMGVATKALADKAEGRAISETVKRLLTANS